MIPDICYLFDDNPHYPVYPLGDGSTILQGKPKAARLCFYRADEPQTPGDHWEPGEEGPDITNTSPIFALSFTNKESLAALILSLEELLEKMP